MQEPSWSELVLMTEERAVARHFDARNDRFLRPALVIIAGIALALVLRPVQDPPWIWMIGASVVVIGLAWALVHYVELMTSEFAVTTSRLIMKVGLISRYTTELLLAKVESIGIQQGLIGRMLGFGDLIVTGTPDSVLTASATTTSAKLRPRSLICSNFVVIDARVHGISGMSTTSAPPAIPAAMAMCPASRPITSRIITRLWLAAVGCKRSRASVATATAVE